MDSWKFFSEGGGVWFSEQAEFTFDGHRSSKDEVMGSEIKPFFNVENCPLVSNTQALERLDLVDLGFSHEIRKSYSISSEPSGEVFSDEFGTDSYGHVVSPLCEEKETGSRISTDFGQSNNQDLSLIDLKLGRLADGGGAKDGEFSKASVPSSSNVSSIPAKRSRSTTLYPLSLCCQVFGCNKDLSSSKGYYKRHKVCEEHTKTAKVVVDGIEQRFCQQCSRFHLLSEFDDVKRSCRRRLAAHNKRRRKPQLSSESGSRVVRFSPPFGFSQLFPGTVFDSGEEMGNFVPDVKNNTGNIQSLSGIHQTSSALSLLSAQSHSHTMSSQLLGAAITNPPINKSGYAPELYSMEAGHGETTTTSHCDVNTVELQLAGDDGIPRGPYLRHDGATTNCHDPLGRRGIVLDLLQLSSHLQRVEQQRRSSESEAG